MRYHPFTAKDAKIFAKQNFFQGSKRFRLSSTKNSCSSFRQATSLPALKVLAFEPGHIDQHLFWGRPAGKRRDARDAAGFYGTGHGFTSQIWFAVQKQRTMIRKTQPATLDFWAEWWCGPCRRMLPVVERLPQNK